MAESLTPNCPLCGHPPLFGPGDEPASCGNGDCPMISWSPSLGLGLYLAPGNVLSTWRRR